MKSIVVFFICLIFSSCANHKSAQEENVTDMSWYEILTTAKGSTVNLMMWQGDPFINKYMRDFVVPKLQEQYQINLQISAGQGNQIVSLVMNEKQAGKPNEIDMSWINGETFYQLRQVDGLYGPFTDHLPNAQYIDFKNPFINTDFQQPVNGLECPWGNVQLCIIYDSSKVSAPPKNLEELSTWVKANPGKFTLGTDFTGLTVLKSWMMAIAGGADSLKGKFDEVMYLRYSAMLWNYINQTKQYWWKKGKTFPNAVASMHQMFANGELYFTMSNNDGEVDNKVLQGLFPPSSRSFVFDGGTIQNSHYMGIIKEAKNIAGAMVVCNFLISPEAQYEKMKTEVWGDGTVLDISTLSAEWQKKFAALSKRKYGPQRSDIQSKALPELAPEYMIRLSNDFRKFVIEK
ncbi:MAG: ABC transporter substrate-binding protein [Chitinophagales bacterium]